MSSYKIKCTVILYKTKYRKYYKNVIVIFIVFYYYVMLSNFYLETSQNIPRVI